MVVFSCILSGCFSWRIDLEISSVSFLHDSKNLSQTELASRIYLAHGYKESSITSLRALASVKGTFPVPSREVCQKIIVQRCICR